MKALSIALCLLALGFQASAQGGFPYNPDANGNETIESGDLIEFLTFFGGAFLPSGVLPVEGGGTGVSTPDSARLVLGVSTYNDVVPLGGIGPLGQITGSLNITQTLAQGFGTTASGTCLLYTSPSPRDS